MEFTFQHENYKCPQCGSRNLELHDTGAAPIPANDEALSFEITSKTVCAECGFKRELMDFADDD